MGLLDVNAEHRHQKQLELEGGRLMFRTTKRLLVVILVLWVLVAMVGLIVGHEQASNGKPAPVERHR